MITYALKVAELREETVDTLTVCLKQPGLKKIKYLPGQYLTLAFRINGRRYLRPYSFSSAPGIDQHLEITVKRVLGGVVSNHIIDTVLVGDNVEVMPPMGDFTLPANLDAGQHIVLWGAGSGITPLISIAKFVLANCTNNVTLAYGNRNHESIIFLDKIKDLQHRYTDRFTTLHFHTKPTVEAGLPNVIQGRIQPDKVLSVLHQAGDISHTLHYICGPVGLKESAKATLLAAGVSAADIFSEDFELVKDEELLKDVITRNVEIIKNGESRVIEVVKNKSILEAGLDSLIEMDYSCQTGNCSVCKGKVIEGEVLQTLKRHEDLKADEYQLCCTYPLTDNIIITI